jgi:hypothetical protein
MVEAVKQHGWDGEWFLRAYDFYGNKIGSDENEEGKIFIESQGWCTMAGIGLDEGLCHKALDAVKERLDSEHGIVLNNPAYTTYHVEMGEISSYPEGYKENAGIFCHNNPWSSSARRWPDAVTTPGCTIPRYCRRMWRRNTRPCTRWSLTSTVRWWPEKTPPGLAKARTPGSRARRHGCGTPSAGFCWVLSPTTRACA